MATPSALPVAEPVHEVPHWLKTLPIAPEFHPTLAEFEDPISYILKIEKQASQYGICKIVPPVSPPSKKTTITHLNRSLSARNPKSLPTFTTRHQQIGFDPRKGRPVQKPVWQSGEDYTLQQFEAKAKQFEKTHLKKCGNKKGYSALEMETLFWRASVDKPFTVEYANDMPGSAFVPVKSKSFKEVGEGTVGETAWNMRGVARSKGSLLRFMKEEIPGVTSPMVYIAMLFSWFAWHVEDHDLHSLNYMHMGASKTWYGVPKDAAIAFQDVVRVHGYGGDFNPLVTFATLGEKTTVMSPEVLVGAGIPCCRLVQNVGEFVVTFPGAYHSGFSHGFNCAEASNIATPEWLRFAKEAAVRRASVNCPPMVSHFQLLYALALTLCSREPMSIGNEPRSSRLKDKKRGEGEGIVKEFFVQSVIQQNELLHALSSHGSTCVLLPRNSSELSVSSNVLIGTQKKVKRMMSLGLCRNDEALEASRILLPDENALERNVRLRNLTDFDSVNETANSMLAGDRRASFSIKQNHGDADSSNSVILDTDMKNSTSQDASLLEKGRFPCVQCGILSFACAALIEPKEAAAQYFMSADSSIFNDWKAGSGVLKDDSVVATENRDALEPNYDSVAIENAYKDGLYDVPVQSGDYQVKVADQNVDVVSRMEIQKVVDMVLHTEPQKEVDVVSHVEIEKGFSSLDLLASAYGNSSDSDEEPDEPELLTNDDNIGNNKLSEEAHVLSPKRKLYDDSRSHSLDPDHHDEDSGSISHSPSELGCGSDVSVRISQYTSYSRRKRKWTVSNVECKSEQTSDCSFESDMETVVPMKSKRLKDSCRDRDPPGTIITESAEVRETDLYNNQIESGPAARAKFSQAAVLGEATKFNNIDMSIQNTSMSLMQVSKEESSRKHIFCLEHAVEVEKQLRPIGGANILLLCHPEYPKVEAEAKSLAQDLGIDNFWKDISFREATKEDQERISLALGDEEADPSNGDWAVKLGINLYYSVHLSKSPLYTKQMPYNSIIYKAFGCDSPINYPMEVKVSGKQKKIVVAGKWCGKVWMSNQVHPYLAHGGAEEEDSMTYTRAAPSLKPYSKLEGKVDISHPIKEAVISEERSSPRVTANINRKTGQKKKRKYGKAATKKQKSPEVSPTQSAEDSSESDSSPLGTGRFIRNGQTKHERSLLRCNSMKNFKQYDSNSKTKIEGGPPTTAKKLGLKNRKFGKEAAKKPESPQSESPSQSAEDSSDSDSSPLSNGRFIRSGQNKRERSPLQHSSVSNIKQYDSNSKVEIDGGPSTRLRRRPSKPVEENIKQTVQKETRTKKAQKVVPNGNDIKNEEAEYHCDLDGCTMGFSSKQELVLHKRNICSVKGCGKKFFSHKYLVQHRRVHLDDRPLKCPWKGCKMTFKWAWARTEHIRVHTGDRPYVCREKGCGQTFRFVSDFSRHKRKTGHSVKAKA